MSPSPPDEGLAALERRLRNLQEDHELRVRQLGRAQEEPERLRIDRDRADLEEEIATARRALQEAGISPSTLSAPSPIPSRLGWPFVLSLLAVALIQLAVVLVPRLTSSEQSGRAVPSPHAATATEPPPPPTPADFPVVVVFNGGGLKWTSLQVRVKNTTGQDVYVKSLELRGSQGDKCDLVPISPTLVAPHPFVRRNETRPIVADLRLDGVTEQELAFCEIKAFAVVALSPTYPAPDSPQSFILSESRVLGN